MRKNAKLTFIFTLAAILLFSVFHIREQSYPDYESSDVPAFSETDSVLEVHFIDVGQGDSTLILNDGHAMLIDAGPNECGTALQFYLKEAGVEPLDYLILTHADADHIGGADVIITKYDIQTVFMNYEERENITYLDVLDALAYKTLSYTIPSVGEVYTLGDATFTIIAPNNIYETSNDNSIGLLLEKGTTRFLFTGDASIQSEKDILANNPDIRATVYKVGHHGSSSSSSEAFLDAVSPEVAVISCAADNSFGHPHTETLSALEERNIEIYRTDEQGSIIAISDGENITWNTVGQQTLVTYICNTNSMKFHLPDCPSVSDMSEKNKLETTLTKEELLALGYTGCKGCNP